MKKQPTGDIVKRFILIHSPEKEKSDVKIDKTLIKQFARRIYGTIREQIIADRAAVEKLLKAIFDERGEAINLSDAPYGSDKDNREITL